MKKLEYFLLTIILLATFFLRLYRINNPIGDWHAFRQADTSAVSKLYVENGINLLYPTYFDISNIQSGKDNPAGYRFVEFPIFNFFQAVSFKAFGVLSLEEWGRLLSDFASVASTLFIFLLVRKHLGKISALFAAFFFAVLPFSIYYGRVILPDPATAMTILGGIYFFDTWISKKNFQFTILNFQLWLAILFTASSFLLKPFALFFVLPMVYLAWKACGWKMVFKWQLYVFAILSVLPLLLWRIWIMAHPEGIPASDWLFNGGNIRFTGAFFYWIFADRLGRLILGYFGIVFLMFGLFKQDEKDYGFFMAFLLSTIAYLTVIARGNVQHDYYQILIIPTVAIFLGRGASFLLLLPAKLSSHVITNTIVSLGIIMVVTAASLTFSWYFVRDYFNINNIGLVTAGQIADKVLPKTARVIAANDGDTSFLYYINRQGWPAYEHGVDQLHQMGADYIVIPTPTQQDFNGFGKKYKVFYSSPEVLIVSL